MRRNTIPIYKVCRVSEHGRRVSVSTEGKYQMRYPLNRWLKPSIPGSAIYCFDSLESARHFLRNYSLIDWVVVEGVGVRYPADVELVVSGSSEFDREVFWRQVNERHDLLALATWYHEAPIGTIWCTEVKLTRVL